MHDDRAAGTDLFCKGRTIRRKIGALAGVGVPCGGQRLGLGPQAAQVPQRQAPIRACAQQLLPPSWLYLGSQCPSAYPFLTYLHIV